MKDGMRRAFLLICSALALFIGARASDAAAQTASAASSARQLTQEFTIYDGDLASRVVGAWKIARIRTLLRDDPSSPELMSLLIERHRVADVFVALQSLQTASPERVVDVLDVLQRSLIRFQLNDARRDGNRLRALLEPIAARVDTLPREVAARVVLALWVLENETGRPLRNSVSATWSSYANTEFAKSLTPRAAPANNAEIRRAQDDRAPDAALTARRALATIASKAFVDEDAARARLLLRAYVRRYPDSPWTWVAAMKLAVVDAMSGDAAMAARAYRDVGRRYADQPIARVVSAYLAGWHFESGGDEARAQAAYVEALTAWDRDYGRLYDFPVRLPDDIESTWPIIDLDELTSRVARLSEELRERDGATVAHAHWLVEQKRYADASTALQAFLRAHRTSPLAADARVLMHQAQLWTALNAGNIWRKEHDDEVCLAILEALEREPYDVFVGIAFLAHASLLHRRGQTDEAARQATSAMQRWWAWRNAEIAKSTLTGLDADVAAIRSEMFRPGGVVPTVERSQFGDLAFDAPPSPFIEVGADVTVTSSGTTTSRTIFQSYAHAPMALPITDEEERLLTYVALIEDTTPSNLPIAYLNLRGRVSWRDLLLGAAPAVTSIEFADDGRTRASVQFWWRGSGYTATLEKIDGRWHVVRLLNIVTSG
jgi:hypothetical protein